MCILLQEASVSIVDNYVLDSGVATEVQLSTALKGQNLIKEIGKNLKMKNLGEKPATNVGNGKRSL